MKSSPIWSKSTLVVVLLLRQLVAALSSSSSHAALHARFEHIDTLSEEQDVVLAWTVVSRQKEIEFHLTAPCQGWLGLGFSDKGSMPGADMAILTKVGETFQVGDYLATDFSMPQRDPDHLQNVVLLGAGRNVTHTWMHIKRPLASCDSFYDEEIGLTPTWIMWAYGDTDKLSYHSPKNRGSKYLYLILTDLDKQEPEIPKENKHKLATFDASSIESDSSNTHSLDVTLSDANGGSITVPPVETSYTCHKIDLSRSLKNNESLYVTGYKAINLEDGLAHHSKLMICKPEVHDLLPDVVMDCYPNPLGCDVFAGWAVGGNYVGLPDDVSGVLGGFGQCEAGKTCPAKLLLSMHYHNPSLQAGVENNYGLRLFFQTRPTKDEYSLYVMNTLFSRILVPAGGMASVSNLCPSSCTRKLPPQGVKAVKVLLHAHKTATSIRLRHIRDGVELDLIAETRFYDFEKQVINDANRRILPGDQLLLECDYDAKNRHNDTLGGRKTNDEMCQAWIAVYPKVQEFFYCTEVAEGTETEGVAYCGPDFPHSGEDWDPRHVVPFVSSERDFTPVDVKDDHCYVALFEGHPSPFSLDDFSLDVFTILFVVAMIFVVARFSLHLTSERFRMMSTENRQSVSLYVTALITLTASLICILMGYDLLFGKAEVLEYSAEENKFVFATGAVRGLTAVKLVLCTHAIELVGKCRVTATLLLHHLMTYCLIIMVVMFTYHTMFSFYYQVGVTFLLYAATEQPVYVALLLRRFGAKNSAFHFRIAAVWDLLSKSGLFFYILALIVNRGEERSHFDFLPYQDKIRSFDDELIASFSTVLYVAQLRQTWVLYKISRKPPTSSALYETTDSDGSLPKDDKLDGNDLKEGKIVMA